MKVVFENEKKVNPIQLLEMKQELCSKYDLRVTKVIEKVTEIRVKLKFFKEHQTWRPCSAPYNIHMSHCMNVLPGIQRNYRYYMKAGCKIGGQCFVVFQRINVCSF